jgi:hypothetical protein
MWKTVSSLPEVGGESDVIENDARFCRRFAPPIKLRAIVIPGDREFVRLFERQNFAARHLSFLAPAIRMLFRPEE